MTARRRLVGFTGGLLVLNRNDAVELVRTRDRSAAFTPLHCSKRLAASGHQRVIHAEAA
jgi:hypothetical protein